MDARLSNDTAAVRADLDFWRELAGGDDVCARELLTLYLGETAAQISIIVSSLAAGRADDVGRAAHTSAGSSITCGDDALAELFLQLEQQARNNRLDEMSVTVPLIVENFQQVHARLTRAIAESTSEPIQERT
jgi:HPt (histidine-containing phosphotransfer) domain-containing protein